MTKSNQDKARIGVIGCGAIAEIYHLPALSSNDQVHLVLADSNANRLQQMQARFGVQDASSDFTALAGLVDAVVVATPPVSHYRISKWFLERGIHVLCEKPLTESVQEARDLVQTAERHGVHLAVNQTRRLFPTYQKIRELIREGALGQLKSIVYHDGFEFDWPAASPHHFTLGAKGAWSDTGVHLLDTVCFWLDTKPELVRSQNDSYGGPEALATVEFRYQECDIEIKVSRLGRLMNGFRLVGTQGTLEADSETFDAVTIQHADGRRTRYRCGSNQVNYNDFAKPMMENWVEVVRGTAEPFISGKSTLATIELLELAYERAERYEMPWNGASGQSTKVEPQQFPVVKEKARSKVLVTGASGFLGGRVVESMLLSGTETPVAAIRNWSRASRVARHAVEIAICDILNPEQVDRVVAGVDAIVHCAKTDDRESIVGGTENLLRSAEKHGIRRFVYLSTAEVYGPDVLGAISEQHATPSTGRLYSDAKIESEAVCRDFAGRVSTTILRPSIIYGPFSSSWTVDMAKRLQSGKWGAFDEHGEGIANLVYVDDLVQAIRLALEHPAADGRVFNVNGPDRLTWNQYFHRFNQELALPELQKISAGQSRWRSRMMGVVDQIADMVLSRYEEPLMRIYLRGGWASKAMKWIKGEINSTPSGSELTDLFSRNASYSDDSIRELLGYQPEVSVEQGLAFTSLWLQLHELAAKRPARDLPGATIDSNAPREQEAALS